MGLSHITSSLFLRRIYIQLILLIVYKFLSADILSVGDPTENLSSFFSCQAPSAPALPSMSQIFRFMDLPAEIRNRIYSYALSLSFYDEAHERSFTSGYSHTTDAKQCNVLLMNHKTSDEAKVMILLTPITLSYGLELEMSSDLSLHPPIGPDSIRDFFPASRLRETSQLTISDVGYRGKERDSLKEKHFLGLARLLREVAEICREGHKLKHVLISFRSDLVHEYIDQLKTSEISQKWMFEVVSSLREIRSVGKGRVILILISTILRRPNNS